MTRTEFRVTGMTFSHCEQAVSTGASQVAGADTAEVSEVTGRLFITSSDSVADEQVLAPMAEASYSAVGERGQAVLAADRSARAVGDRLHHGPRSDVHRIGVSNRLRLRTFQSISRTAHREVTQ